MKTNIFKWILALLPLFAVVAEAQQTDTLATRNWVREVMGIAKPPVKLEDCKPRPTISEITNISSIGLRFKFDAKGLTNFKYTITGARVYVDSIKPKSNTVEVLFPSNFPNGNYTLAIIGLNCAGTDSRIFTIAGGVDPPSSKDCEVQPTFNIKGFTAEAATIQFNAKDLFDLTLSLMQGDKTIKTTSYHPDVNTLYFPFGSVQKAGNYTIKLTPITCTAKVNPTQDFTIKKDDVGEVDPPVVVDPGGVGYKLITRGMPEHMRITRRTVGDIDYITDNTKNDLWDKYEYRYIIGADVVTQSTPLKDYPYARNNGFRVIKFNSKKGIGTINKWPGQGQDGSDPDGYYNDNAGQSFVYNISAAVETGAYSGAQSGFKNYFPANYDPSSAMPQWADITPDIKMPEGHFFVLSRGDWSMDQVMRKGVTHIRHHEIPRPNGDETLAFQMRLAGKTYNDVPLSTTIFGGIPNNPSDEEVKQMIARHTYPDALWIGETMEQSHAIDPSHPENGEWLYNFNTGVTANQKKQFIDKGIPALNCFNYFQFWPPSYHLGQVSAEASKNMLRLDKEYLPYSNFSPGAPLSPTTLIVEAIYLGAPDIQQGGVYDFAFKMDVFDHMGYVGGGFLAPEHEWRPNNMFEYIYPEGKFYTQGKIPLDPNSLITYVFFSQVYGKVFVNWGGSSKANAGRIFERGTFEPSYWKPNGSSDYKLSSPDPAWNGGSNGHVFKWLTTPEFPYAKTPGVGYYGYNAGTDLCRFAQQVYVDTWGQIGDDGAENYLSFQIDDNDWINAVNDKSDDIIDAYHQKRGLVYSTHKSGQIAWFYVNPFGDTVWHDLKVKFPNGRITRARVSGNGIHAKIESL